MSIAQIWHNNTVGRWKLENADRCANRMPPIGKAGEYGLEWIDTGSCRCTYNRMDQIGFDEFLKVDIRSGTVVRAEHFAEAHKPAIKLWIEFGEQIGRKKSSAQITDLYAPAGLIGRKVMAVVNFPARQIGPFMSEVLVLGFPDEDGRIVLADPGIGTPDGARLA